MHTWTLLVAACGAPEAPVRAYPIATLADAVGGPKAIAQPGDFVLENEHARVAILADRASLGPGLHGGSLVDADLRSADPTTPSGLGNDQFAELFATVNLNVADPSDGGEVLLLKDGSDGEAVVRTRGRYDPFLSLLDGLWSLLDAPEFYLWTDYVARDGEPWFTIRTWVTTVEPGGGGGEEPPPSTSIAYQTQAFPLIDWALETGLVLGDFFLQGGSVDVFVPGVGFDEDGLLAEADLAGRNPFLEPFQLDFVAGVADGVSYGLAAQGGDLFLPLFTSSQTVAIGGGRAGDGSPGRFPVGEAYSYERYFFVGHGDVASVFDQYIQVRGIPHGTVRGNVLERATEQPASGATVLVYRAGEEGPFSQIGTDLHPTDAVDDGSFQANLPIGDWDLVAHQPGRPPSDRVRVHVVRDGVVDVALAVERPGVLQFSIRDEAGRLVPAKLTVFRDDGQPATLDPVLGDPRIGGAPQAVAFAPNGAGTVALPPGRFRAVASRGLEYELDRSAAFTIADDQSASLELQVVRSIDTTGWVSADFHVHGIASFDSGVSQADRVLTMVAEGVEFFASSDHDHLVDYAPTVAALGLEEWVQTAVGNETTTIELGHFIGFPLAHDFLAEAGGDHVDWTGKDPAEIVDSLRLMGAAGGHDPFVFVAHPRDGILGYFDQYGFDPYAGSQLEPALSPSLLSLFNDQLDPQRVTWDFDGIELLNGKRLELLRTPTQPEMDAFAAGEAGVYDFFSRTAVEQEALAAGTYPLSADVHGQVDDWFTLLNLGFTFTALGNSDTHGLTATESGCPRNYVLVEEDEPAFLDDQALADAVREHRVVASYGPFVRMWVDGAPIGSTVVDDGPIEVHVDVQAPRWIPVDRVELYENGALIREWAVQDTGDVLRFDETVALTPSRDAWYVAIAMGDGDLGPVFTPVELSPVDLQDVVTGALAGAEEVADLVAAGPPIPRTGPVKPYAITNPIWVDRDGDGFDPAGVAPWMRKP